MFGDAAHEALREVHERKVVVENLFEDRPIDEQEPDNVEANVDQIHSTFSTLKTDKPLLQRNKILSNYLMALNMLSMPCGFSIYFI